MERIPGNSSTERLHSSLGYRSPAEVEDRTMIHVDEGLRLVLGF